MPVTKQLRKRILARDSNRCRNCGSDKDLQIHEIISVEDRKMFRKAGQEIPASVYNHPANLRTFCRDCHSTTFSGIRKWLFTSEEQDEWNSIWGRRRELSQARQEFKNEYHPNWNALAYQEKKWEIDKALKNLQERAVELKKIGENRKKECQKEIWDIIYG